jgi:MFS family permease
MTPTAATPSAAPKATLAILLALYVAQGLPSGLFAHALPVFWREAGVSLAWIGALKLLALPWILKVLWAPLVDASLRRVSPARWVVGLQLFAALCLVGLGAVGLVPDSGWFPVTLAAILITNLLMATQDIVTDGLAVRKIAPHWRGVANTFQVAGYKIGMLAGGACLLILARHLDTQTALLVPASLLVLLVILIARSPALAERNAATDTPESTGQSLTAAFTGLIRQPGALFWLAIVACYKIGDALGSGMVRPMLTDGGWATDAIGTFTLVTTLVGLAGAALGGWLYTRLGGRRSLIWAGLAQALTMAGWGLVAVYGTGGSLVYGVGVAEQLADGASTVVLFAMMMNLCRQQWAGTDFTLQASLQVVFAGLFGLLGGVIADLAGYAALFLAAGISGLVVILLYAAHTLTTLKIRGDGRIDSP